MKLKLPNELKTTNIILEINANIKDILSEILKMQSEIITDRNENEIKELLGKADLLITECHTTSKFKTGKNEKFNRLVYEYQRLNLKYESYQLNQQINNVNKEYLEIKDNQEKIKNETNNLVYNILGFIASFSIVSAVVGVISQINGIINIMIFMSFTILLLLTTLIALNNFYGNNKSKNILQNNYFLWIIVAIIIIVLIIVSIITTSINNKGRIYNYFDQKTENVIKNIVTEKINKEIS